MHSVWIRRALCACIGLAPATAHGEEFPASAAGYDATLIRITGANSARARAYGEVRRENAEAYCRAMVKAEGEQKDVNLKLALCTEDILTVEGGRVVSVSANCAKKTLTNAAGEQFGFTFRVTDGGGLERLWRRTKSKSSAHGNGDSGDTAAVDRLFRILCPGFVQAPTLPSRPAIR